MWVCVKGLKDMVGSAQRYQLIPPPHSGLLVGGKDMDGTKRLGLVEGVVCGWALKVNVGSNPGGKAHSVVPPSGTPSPLGSENH